MSAPLSGLRVWITRPAHQAADWAAGIEAAGAQVDLEPLLAIAPPADVPGARAALAAAEKADIVIATSTNAVRAAWQIRLDFCPAGTLCAIGQATADAFERAAGRAVTRPAQCFTSEAALALPALAEPEGRSVTLLSGEGGRDALADTIVARGAAVTKAALYRREPVTIAPERLALLLDRSDAIVITSGEAFAHLCALVRAAAGTRLRAALAGSQLVVPSLRVLQLGNDDLLERAPIVPVRMTLDGVVAALAQVRAGGRQ